MEVDYYARYFLEHKAVPRSLYNEGAHFLNAFMLKGGSAMKGLYDRATVANPSYVCPYDSDDFHVHFRTYVQGDESCVVLRVEMPEPEQALLCRAVYLCYGTRGGREFYVTSELCEDGSYYICAWNNQGQHINYGSAPKDANDEMDLAAELFWRSIDDGRKTEPKGICCS